jgi:hypothetical protein
LEHLCEKTGKGEPLTPTTGPIPGDNVYCTTAKAFREDEKTPPVVELLTKNLKTSERAGVQIKLLKISSVSMTIKLGEKTVWTNNATVEGGKPRLLWVTSSKAGLYTVILKAKDLAGNEEVADGAIAVQAAPKAKAKGARIARVEPITHQARRQPAL